MSKTMTAHLQIQNTDTADQYTWGDGCIGWHLLRRNDLSVIQERVPPARSEVVHLHEHSRQFFFVLEGEATIMVGNEKVLLARHQGIEIPPGVVHQFRNDSSSDVVFLVISMPSSHGDRLNPP
jgi:mannose-6-phosphate isomerase-like protein (cupin superfamily)